MKKIITLTALSTLAVQAVADFKDLNTPLTLVERKVAQKAISYTTAGLVRLNVIKTPSWTKRTVLRFRKNDRTNLEIWNKTAIFLALFLGNTIVKVGDVEDEYATVFGINLDLIQNAIDVAKVVLFEELIDLGLNKLDIEAWIVSVGKDITETVEG